MQVKPRISIIGSGIGGLAAAIFGQLNGFDTTIFEAHSRPGGQCTSWQRRGYTFDPCLHNFNGFKPQTRINTFWQQLGALPCEMVPRKEFVSAVFPDGSYFHSYFDLTRLKEHLEAISPADAAVINEYCSGLQSFVGDLDWFGLNYFGSFREKLTILPFFIRRLKYFRYTLGSWAGRFKHPNLQRAFPLLRYSTPQVPLLAYLAEYANFINGDSGWPRGGGSTLVQNMTARYLELGGTLRYRQEVTRILTEDNRACGVELREGERHSADFVISDADGRKTILEMLEGRYVNKKITRYCEPNPADKEVSMSVMVFLGVKRDLAAYPSSLILFLDKPELIGDRERDHLDLQIYGFDTSLAPPGKGVIKVELSLPPAYFSALYADKDAYQAAKDRLADQVITLLEKQFPGLRRDIEVAEVVTLNTWERYMRGHQGFNNFPNKHEPASIRQVINVLFGLDRMYTLPGLRNFYLVGQWVTSMGSLFTNAASGQAVIKKICRQCGRKYRNLAD